MPIIDASVYVALVNNREPAYARCWRWFDQARQAREPVLAPVVLLAEVAAAVSRGSGDPDKARRAVEQLETQRAVELVPVSLDLARRAARAAADCRLRGFDAIYVALAAAMNDRLVTLDREQFERGRLVAQVIEP